MVSAIYNTREPPFLTRSYYIHKMYNVSSHAVTYIVYGRYGVY